MNENRKMKRYKKSRTDEVKRNMKFAGRNRKYGPKFKIRKRKNNYHNERDCVQSENIEICKEKLDKYSRGVPIDNRFVKVEAERKKFSHKEKNVNFALKQSVRSELLLTEEPGYIETEGVELKDVTQNDIRDAVDLNNAAKRFDLVLNDFGPYSMNYTRNGRFLLLGGRKGHVAAMDWISKKLMCEINVMESVHDVAWLHQETLYSVAQKKWVYFYDNQGIEIHCVKQLHDVVRLVFLPYHFLLSTVGSSGRLSWLDVTVGKIVEQFHIPVHHNPATVAQHPGNAMICIGEPSGVINFWSPNYKKPTITKWCHRQPLCALAFDPRGHILATASVDRSVKLWDARNLQGPLQHYVLRSAPSWINLSQRGLMAFGINNIVEIYEDCTTGGEIEKKLYLRHNVLGSVRNMEFCPYEDILGIAHSKGFSSILVPGCAEANFDALESNPFRTKSQRREAEIQRILSKIPPELITWDPNEVRKVHVPSLEDIIEEKKKIGYIKPPDIQIEPRYKTGKKSKTSAIQRKKIMKEEFRRNHVKMVKELEADKADNAETKKKKKSSVLDRFRPKKNN